eukprot:CAMPEP_0206148794 /NCGR_PEP_ID=MMETSP1473-20131121/37437_1 /ASSEMBLY_ACC=CAM_ASM_001109 /TAXON_ID=1461547 /ORGANISM="Stichococcus sp, Strain RCC1054" /LENGTH=396 /DNA_ID=CAMNT_0053546217 /DNA_START=1065 /DNA_END=2255 /DNA_ORIENTATION=-
MQPVEVQQLPPSPLTALSLPLRDRLSRLSSEQGSPRTSLSRTGSIDLRSLPLASRLSCIPAALAARFEPGTLALVQVWTSCASSWSAVAKAAPASIVMRTQPMGAHLSDPLLAPFRSSSCESGILRSAVGMLGKVWSSGSLAVVQNLSIIPTSVHPRSKLHDSLVERVSELAYIPVYDLRNPDVGVVACLEVMMSAFATQALVANVISHTCDLLSSFQLSLGKPADSPPAPTALPSPFANVPLSPSPVYATSSRGSSPRDYSPRGMAPGSPTAMSPAAASAAAAAALQFQTPQQACLAALQLQQQQQQHSQQSVWAGLPPVDRRASMGSHPPQLKHLRPFPGCVRQVPSNSGSGTSSGTGYDGGASPRSPSPPRRAMSMSRTTSMRRLDSLADMAQ